MEKKNRPFSTRVWRTSYGRCAILPCSLKLRRGPLSPSMPCPGCAAPCPVPRAPATEPTQQHSSPCVSSPRPGAGQERNAVLLSQWFSDISRHQHHLRGLLRLTAEPTPGVSNKVGLGGAPEFAFLASSQVMLTCWCGDHTVLSSTLVSCSFPSSSFQTLSSLHWQEVTVGTLLPLCAHSIF